MEEWIIGMMEEGVRRKEKIGRGEGKKSKEKVVGSREKRNKEKQPPSQRATLQQLFIKCRFFSRQVGIRMTNGPFETAS